MESVMAQHICQVFYNRLYPTDLEEQNPGIYMIVYIHDEEDSCGGGFPNSHPLPLATSVEQVGNK